MDIKPFFETIVTGIELVAVAIIAIGLFWAFTLGARGLLNRQPGREVYRGVRRDFGRVLLLGLEVLIAADIVETVTVDLTLQSVSTLCARSSAPPIWPNRVTRSRSMPAPTASGSTRRAAATSDLTHRVPGRPRGAKVEIKGSEVVTGLEQVMDEVWTVTLPNSFFGGFNPYADVIRGDWFNGRGREHHTGAVYLNGDWLTEAADLEEVLMPAGTKPDWLTGGARVPAQRGLAAARLGRRTLRPHGPGRRVRGAAGVSRPPPAPRAASASAGSSTATGCV
jgi:uncharacterized membrane protein